MQRGSLKGRLLCVCALLVFCPMDAWAAPPSVHLLKGSDALEQFDFDAYSCFVSARYIILEISVEGAIGSDLRVFPNALKAGDDVLAACAALRERPSAEGVCCDERGDEYFFGVWQGLLFSDEGSDAERGLVIYSLAGGKGALSFDDVRDAEIRAADKALHFTHTLYELPAGGKVPPCASGASAGDEAVTFRQAVVLNLETLAWKGVGDVSCELMEERGGEDEGGDDDADEGEQD